MLGNFVSDGSLAATAWSAQRIDLVTLNGDGGPMYHLAWDGPNGWQQDCDSRGGQFKESDTPAILNFGEGTLLLLGVDSGSGYVTAMPYNSSGWFPWDAGYMNINGLGAAVYDATTPSAFAYGVDGSGQLVSNGWFGSGWFGSPTIDDGEQGAQPTLASNLVVSSWGPQDNDIFGLDSQGAVWHLGHISTGFGTSWDALGGQFTSIPSAVSWGENRIDVFVTGEDTNLQHQWWDGSSWASGWQSLGGTLNSPPSAVSWGSGRLDIFALATDGSLQHLSYDSSTGWQASWDNLGGGPFTSPPVAVSREENILDVFVASGCTVSHLPWTGTSWAPWEDHGCPTGSSSAPPTAAPTTASTTPTSAAGSGAPTVVTTTFGGSGGSQGVSVVTVTASAASSASTSTSGAGHHTPGSSNLLKVLMVSTVFASLLMWI